MSFWTDEFTYKQAIALILSRARRPLRLQEIEREIKRRHFRFRFTSSGMRSIINKDVAKKTGLFKRVEKDQYVLRRGELNPSEVRGRGDIRNQVLVVKTDTLNRVDYFQGVRRNYKDYYKAMLEVEIPQFMDREEAEISFDYKQIVSYVLVTYKGELLRFTRHKSRINKFMGYLDGKFSVGFGGHVQFGDFNLFTKDQKDSGYRESVVRELDEELGLKQKDIKSLEIIGVLNDDSTPRGMLHFAFVHLIELSQKTFSEREEFVREIKPVSFSEISEDFGSYEHWSQSCIQEFFHGGLEFQCYVESRLKPSSEMPPPYVAVIGKIGSGKSHVCKSLANKYGFTHVPCSSILGDLLGVDVENIDREELQQRGLEFIKKSNGHRLFAKKIFEHIKQSKNSPGILIDGLRYPETLDELENLLGRDILVVYIHSRPEILHKNYVSRHGAISDQSFSKTINHEVEWEIESFMPQAQIMILNQGPLESLVLETTKFFEKMYKSVFLRDAWNINADERHKQILRGNDITYHEILTPKIIELLQQLDGYRNFSLLDIGCGSGVLTKLLGEYTREVVGIDPSARFIDIAKKNSARSNVTFQNKTIEEFAKESKFDVVVANMTLHTVPDLDKAMHSVHKSLKAGGYFIFSLPHPRYYPLRSRVYKAFKEDGYEYEKESFHRIPFTISKEPTPLPSPTPYFHRPYQTYEEAFNGNGFTILKTEAPFPNESLMKTYDKAWSSPHILFGLLKKF